MIRIGHGYDVHRLVPDRKLVLGGTEIPSDLGLLGHSDADVLLHAVCDAILGAIGAGDIGRHFPDSDPVYKGIDSRKLLVQVVDLAEQRGFVVSNLDTTIVAEKPKLAPYIEQMASHIASDCRIDVERVNVKATTTEELGFAGRREGISAHAVVLMQSTEWAWRDFI